MHRTTLYTLFFALAAWGCIPADEGTSSPTADAVVPDGASSTEVDARADSTVDMGNVTDAVPPTPDADQGPIDPTDGGGLTVDAAEGPTVDQGVLDAGALDAAPVQADASMAPTPDMALRLDMSPLPDMSPPPDRGLPPVPDAQVVDAAVVLPPDMGQAPAPIFPPMCEAECCTGVAWRRPGGFWSDLAGHVPDWRPDPASPCVFGQRQDPCDRRTAYTLGRGNCEAAACEPCEQNLNEFRRQFSFRYDAFGNVRFESESVRRHIDWSDDTTIRHTYDENGLRTATAGLYLPDADRPRSLYLRYVNDEFGRLVREEAVHEPFIEFDPVPWEPTRISTFVYGPNGVEEQLDMDADGEVDQVIQHPVDGPE